MARMTYGGAARLTVGDRELAHLQFVISDKLRRREPFHFTWTNGLDEGGGRVAVWIHASAPLIFTFDDRGPHRINLAWIKLLATAANSPGGLHLIPEPGPEEPAADVTDELPQ